MSEAKCTETIVIKPQQKFKEMHLEDRQRLNLQNNFESNWFVGCRSANRKFQSYPTLSDSHFYDNDVCRRSDPGRLQLLWSPVTASHKSYQILYSIFLLRGFSLKQQLRHSRNEKCISVVLQDFLFWIIFDNLLHLAKLVQIDRCIWSLDSIISILAIVWVSTIICVILFYWFYENFSILCLWDISYVSIISIISIVLVGLIISVTLVVLIDVIDVIVMVLVVISKVQITVVIILHVLLLIIEIFVLKFDARKIFTAVHMGIVMFLLFSRISERRWGVVESCFSGRLLHFLPRISGLWHASISIGIS